MSSSVSTAAAAARTRSHGLRSRSLSRPSMAREDAACAPAAQAASEGRAQGAFSVPSYLKVILTGLPAATVTSCVFSPYRSCQDATVYLPGGTLSILKSPVSAGEGWYGVFFGPGKPPRQGGPSH